MRSTDIPNEAEDTARDRSPGRFVVVGIGASAGGLEAFTQLLKHLPLDTGMAFVLVQHLDPGHESALAQILSRATTLPVREITNDQVIEPDHVYVIPPNTDLEIREGALRLRPRTAGRTPHRPIDTFFESLAADKGEQAIGVVLSGTASDGTLGLGAIKAEGGITFAQDDSAKHDSMPRSAVAAGSVDLVLAPADIAKELARIAKHPSVAGHPFERSSRGEEDHAEAVEHQDDGTALPSGGKGTPGTGSKVARAEAQGRRGEPRKPSVSEDGYKRIMLMLHRHSGVDFSLYKSTTIRRRITRRMVLTKQETLQEYERSLRDNHQELDSLFSDVLISVTSFFRNPETFETLQREVFPKLLAQRGDDPIRCWVLGCSTGQEAYSLVISFVETAERVPTARRLQVFATDLNDKLLEKARQGLYAKSLAHDISPERLRRHFVEQEGGYRISKALREMVVFARQNFVADPPFSRMDLVSCRNLLIYLDPSLQKKAMPTFHYALKPGGFLLLGASESIGEFTDLFEPIDRKHKIFSKKAGRTPAFHPPARKGPPDHATPDPGVLLPIRRAASEEPQEGIRGELNAQREADRIAVSQFAPPGVLINDDLQILQFRGPTGAYLEPPKGKATFDVLKMAREGLMHPLRAAIQEARKTNKPVRADNVRVRRNGETKTIRVEVIPLRNLRERCFLVVFDDLEAADRGAVAKPQTATPPRSKEQESERITELEADLAEAREYLQTVQEQQEVANEELQASNEEVQSANEELQSINEELETSKEELESANEELVTVNEEMSHRNVELNRLNNDLVNLQTSTRLAVLLLGRDLSIRRFSPQAEREFDLQAIDVGRPIGHIRHNLMVGPEGGEARVDLESLSAETIATVREQEREVQDKAGRWLRLRARPYLTLDNQVDGVVLVLMDIDALKRGEQRLQKALAASQHLQSASALLLEGGSDKALYQKLVDVAVAIMESDMGSMQIVDEQSDALRLLAWKGFDPEFGRIFEMCGPGTRTCCALARETGRRVIVPDVEAWEYVTDTPELEAHRTTGIRAVQSTPLFTRSGRLVGMISTHWRAPYTPDESTLRSLDVLAREAADLMDRRSAEDAADRVRKESEESLHEADRRKNEFLAMLAHELRGPLAPIRNSLQILRMHGVTGVEIESATTIMERQLSHMARLIDDLIDVSRISRGKLQLRREPTDVTSVVRSAAQATQPICEAMRHDLRVALPPEPIYVDADPTRLAQVVGNLLNNACKFTDAGGRIALTLEQENEEAVIRVRDTGVGITPDQLPRIFDLFTQVDSSMERSRSGLGIGLSLVKDVVEMHGGSVTAQSAGSGQGSEFVVRLPLMAEHSRPPKAESTDDLGPTTAHRILVVDDNKDSAESLAMLLSLKGHEVHTAHDGLAALEHAEKIQPDLILLDIGLPGLNGFEVARRIRMRPGAKGVKLVALTGWGQEEYRRRSHEAGFDDHLVKPVTPENLSRVLLTIGV